jgi:polyisoprenoid-binding protein YceI
MKKNFLFLLLIFINIKMANGKDYYKIDPLHTNLIWSASHFDFSRPSGKFTDVDGKIIIDEKNPQKSSVEVKIRTSSISTGFEKFDAHLKSSDFLDVEKFPVATFKSTAVRLSNEGIAQVSGSLTIKDISKPIVLMVKINKIDKNPISQKKTVGMTISGSFKRSQYGIKYGIPGISDDVKINIESEAIYEGEESKIKKDDSEKWQIINDKSTIDFKTSQNGSEVKGGFKKFSGNIIFDPNYLNKSSIEFSVETSSIEMGFAEAVDTIKGPNWLSTLNFPLATFKSDLITAKPGKNNFATRGNLKIKDKTIPIEILFNFKGLNSGYAHAVGSFNIKRTDFNIGDRNINKANGVAENVQVNFEIHAKK